MVNLKRMFIDPQLQESFARYAIRMKVPEGAVLMNPGDFFHNILISGCIRVLRQNENGNEIFLYHLMPGETCVMSLTCYSMQTRSEVKTIAEESTELWLIPISVLDEWQQYKEWRDFISHSYKVRFDKLLKTVDELAFEKMDDRLWKYLSARSRARESDLLNISQLEIAGELSIQRESVTRLLKKLQEEGLVETGRGHIRILKLHNA